MEYHFQIHSLVFSLFPANARSGSSVRPLIADRAGFGKVERIAREGTPASGVGFSRKFGFEPNDSMGRCEVEYVGGRVGLFVFCLRIIL